MPSNKPRRLVRTPAGITFAAFDDTLEIVTFSIDKTGALTETITTPDGPCCSITTAISQPGRFTAGAYILACQQSGLTQTDVFAIDKTGSLTVAWRPTGGGSWTGPIAISPAARFMPGAPLAASQQFGLPQTDVFGVDTTGALTVSWVDGGGAWQGPARISPQGEFPAETSLAASQQVPLNQTDVFAVGNGGQLMVSWVDGAGAWQGPSPISPAKFALPGAEVCANAQSQQNQTNVCVTDRNGKLNHFWVVGAGAWNGPSLV
jgi:hypothetical protein